MDHALVTETGESFLTHAQLVRHIREKCGDAIADYVGEFLGEDARSAANRETLEKIRESLNGIGSFVSDMEIEIDRAMDLMTKAGIE
ncbi:MAG: hypothetical protein IIZ93_00600 [Acidaminococcaceae bacterium]|nr:hypothetical protein [Acidaminococcaceae bacterium]